MLVGVLSFLGFRGQLGPTPFVCWWSPPVWLSVAGCLLSNPGGVCEGRCLLLLCCWVAMAVPFRFVADSATICGGSQGTDKRAKCRPLSQVSRHHAMFRAKAVLCVDTESVCVSGWCTKRRNVRAVHCLQAPACK